MTPIIRSDDYARTLRRIRLWLAAFMILLVLSGITAFPVRSELNFAIAHKTVFPELLQGWLQNVSATVNAIGDKYPYIFYGFDWLAFAHIVIALFFTGVYRFPVQNAWVLRIGMIACIGIFPLAFIAGEVRGIPVFWRLIDCSFGVFGILPLLRVERLIKKLKQLPNN